MIAALPSTFMSIRSPASLEELLRRDAGTLDEGAELGPCDLRDDHRDPSGRFEPAIGPGNDSGRVSYRPRDLHQAIRDRFRMLDVVRRRIDHARNEHDVLGEDAAFEEVILV